MHPDSVVLKFLDAVDADLTAGGLRELESYVDRFPGQEALIRAEYRRLSEEPGRETKAVLGAVVGGRYRLLESLGRGGFGEVFLAEDSLIQRRLAIKVLNRVHALSDEWRRRLVREAEATNRIRDDGMCPIFDVGVEGEAPYLVMPWIHGRALDRVLTASAGRGEGLVRLGGDGTIRARRDALLLLIERIARTLHVAHQAGVVHRDVKPANVIVRPDGRPVLIDFGLAWLESNDQASKLSWALGTPAYAAPEVLRGGRVAPDPRMDVWSLGAVLVECLTLRRPFVPRPGVSLERCVLEDSLPRLAAGLGRDVQAVVETALSRKPSARYLTAEAFADDLSRVRRGEPVTVRAAGSLRRLSAWARARPREISLGVTITALLLSGAIVTTSQWVNSRETAVVARAVKTLAGSVDLLVRDADKLARFGFAIGERAAEAESLLQAARDLRAGVGAAPYIDRSLARVLLASGRIHLQLGKVAVGVQRVEEALQLLRGLAGPDQFDDEASISHALVLLGDARGHVDDVEGALQQFRAALEVDQTLLSREPQNAERISNVGFGHLRIGFMLDRLGRVGEALRESQKAVDALQLAEAAEPANDDRPMHTAEAVLDLVGLMTKLHRPHQQQVGLLKEIEPRLLARAGRFPLDPTSWKRLHRAAGRRFALTRPGKRLALGHSIVDYANRALRNAPDSPYYTSSLSSALRSRSTAHLEIGQIEDADKDARAALAAAYRAAEASPRIWVFADELHWALLNAANVARRHLDPDRADALAKEAIEAAEAQWQRARDRGRLHRLASVLLDPRAGKRVAPDRAIELIEAWRASGGELTPALQRLRNHAVSMSR